MTQVSTGGSSRLRPAFISEFKKIMTSVQGVFKSVENSKPVFSPSQKAIEDAIETWKRG